MKYNLGDIFNYLIESKNKYAAYQVVHIDDMMKKTVILTLDYYQNEPISKENIEQLKPFWQDHHSWEGMYEYFIVRNEIPDGHLIAGNLVPCLKLEELDLSEDIGSGFDPLQITLQYKWLSLPKEYRERYKLAKDGKLSFIVDGEKCFGMGISTVTGAILDTIKTGEELDVYPCLGKIDASGKYDWISPYLKKTPYITELEWTNHEQSVIDMRGTGLLSLSVSTKGVKKIFLGEDIDKLYFPDITIPVDLEVTQTHSRQQLSLQLNACLPTINLKNLNVYSLTILNLIEGDIEQIFSVFPNLTELWIKGKPGTISNISSLSKFKQLRSLVLIDVFGFSENDFPTMNELPYISKLWMDSIPTDVAKKVKKEFSKVQDIYLWITKPRKDEWLQANLNNPFRNWDGDKYIPSAHAKKAAKLYTDFLKQVKLLKTNTSDNPQQVLEKIVTDYTLEFNKMDKKASWIGTIEREHIAEVLNSLLKEISIDFGETVDTTKLDDIFESTRIF